MRPVMLACVLMACRSSQPVSAQDATPPEVAPIADASHTTVLATPTVHDANMGKPNEASSTWCTDDSEGSLDSITNTKVIEPYAISARDAQVRASHSKHLAALRATAPRDFITIDIVTCPTRCDRAARACGYNMRVANHSNIGKVPSILVGWIYVDAVDATLWWDDGAGPRSEALPP